MGDLWNDKCTRIYTTLTGSPVFPSTPSNWFHKFIRDFNVFLMIFNTNSLQFDIQRIFTKNKKASKPFSLLTKSWQGQ
jgi:hypothetical protein